ncbi:hypothetical protein [Microvirga arabica]|uniref:hypothetical protein n=1 Tax=Microvirga arabica TaxID=1128671 RepID=UPI00193997BB|nr:hypothetical protein [Microvirga arabica]MBM1170097.1 hypothetical protein [Microvirga arabica]
MTSPATRPRGSSTARRRSRRPSAGRSWTPSRARRSKGVRSDQLVEAYDGELGKRSASEIAKATAKRIAEHFDGIQLDPVHAVEHAVPSARPANMRKRGMRHDKARTKLRAGDIEDWGLQRLLAVAAVGLRNPRITFDD